MTTPSHTQSTRHAVTTTITATITATLLAMIMAAPAACTSEAGAPWAHVEAELTIERAMNAEGEAPFTIEVVSLHLDHLTLAGPTDLPANRPANQEAGHDHEHDLDLDPRDDSAASLFALFTDLPHLSPLTFDEAIALGDEPVLTAGAAVEVELAVEALRIEGKLQRDQAAPAPVIILVDHADFHAPVDAHFGPDEASDLHLALHLELPADWLEGVVLDALVADEDGVVEISEASNPEAHVIVTSHWRDAHFTAEAPHDDVHDGHDASP